MLAELNRRFSEGDINGNVPGKREAQTTFPRAENPLFIPLSPRPANLQRFREVVNGVINQLQGTEVELPSMEQDYLILTIAFNGYDDTIEKGVKVLLGSLYQNDRFKEGVFTYLPPDRRKGVLNALRNKITFPLQCFYFVAPTVEKDGFNDPMSGEGLLFIASPRKADVKTLLSQKNKNVGKPQDGVLEIHYAGSLSEVELAYQTVMLSLILTKELDLSSLEKFAEALPFRKGLFMRLYHEMLSDMLPPAAREEIYGLDSQIKDIEANLFQPLVQKSGRPMNTLLVGAAGVGKSFVSRYFDFHTQVISIPISVGMLSQFEGQMLPRISRLQKAFDLPAVLIVDDVEHLFQDETIIYPDGGRSQGFNPERRAWALSLLERMRDTYRIYLLGTLNQPPQEAAFLRRFNLVYLPLPSSDQRKFMLTRIINKGPLSDSEYDALIRDLTEKTADFNYSGLALIVDYLENQQLKSDLTPSKYRTTLINALDKAKISTNVKRLREDDKQAASIVKDSHPPSVGFLSNVKTQHQ